MGDPSSGSPTTQVDEAILSPLILYYYQSKMAEEIDLEAVAALRKKRQFKKFTFRGLELEKLLDLSHDELLNVVHARARRRIQRGLTRKPLALIKKLRKAKTGECFFSFSLVTTKRYDSMAMVNGLWDGWNWMYEIVRSGSIYSVRLWWF